MLVEGHPMNKLAFPAALLVVALATTVVAAPRYIELKPLADVVDTPVAAVSARGPVSLPLITWGGDVATVHGNGDARATRSGSIFDRYDLSFRLVREDRFATQVANYLSGRTPYLRGTLGMIASASDVLSRDARTKPVIFYQLTWSSGGDALVVKSGIRDAADLNGRTIAVQAYGPHVDYLVRVLADAGLKFSDVQVKWLPDLTGTDDSPMAALYQDDVDAVFVIIPDALALTSGGSVGTGAEDSVQGARILMSTKTASRVIADVYAVRADYLAANRAEVERLSQALLEAEQSLRQRVAARDSDPDGYRATMASAAELLLDSAEALADAEGLYADCEFVGVAGNVRFFTDANHPRRMSKVAAEIVAGFRELGLASGTTALVDAGLDYRRLEAGLGGDAVERPRFREDEVAALVTRRQQRNALDEGALFRFEVYFRPNQSSFSADLYQGDFERVVDLAATYAGAIITVEGHSDPMGYLRAKKNNQPNVVLGRIKQSARNLSHGRAQTVRDAIIDFAAGQGVGLDASQFAVVGHGIAQPNTGICGADPCAPKTEEEWRSNMRVEFRIIQVEAESDVFQPL